jgi:hypothetical protein
MMKKEGKCKSAKMQKSTRLLGYVLICFLFAGCDSLRFAPTEAQKQNAWLHNRTTTIAADTARLENASEKLQALTQLSEIQSRAFSSHYGLPKEFPQAETAEDVLIESNWQLARTALQQGAERPDAWEVADSMLELGIGICALLGGVYGTRAVGFLRQNFIKSTTSLLLLHSNKPTRTNHPKPAKSLRK